MKIELLNINFNDAPIIAEWKRDKELSASIMSNYSPITNKEAKAWIEKNTQDSNQRLFGIYYSDENDNKNKELQGVIRLMFIDYEAKTAELGIYIGNTNNRGKGVGKSSLILLLSYGFEQMKLNKIYLKVREDNQPAINLYKNLGFEIEGVLQEHFKENDTFLGNNILCMAIFNDNFRRS